MKKILFSFFICSLLIIPFTGFAAAVDPPTFEYQSSDSAATISDTTGLGDQDPTTMVIYGINLALGILGLFFMILMIYGGFIWMNARGREEEVTKAKNIIISAIIGLILIIASYAVSNYVYSQISETTQTSYFEIIPAAQAAQAAKPYELQDLDFEIGEDDKIAEGTQLGTQNPALVLGYLINVILGIIGLFFLILMIYGGFIWMNARGREEEVTKARNLIISAIIGVVVILASYGLANYIFTVIYDITISL